MERTRNFLRTSEKDIEKMFLQKSLDTETLLKWSKLLEYDFFRIYSQHLILYSPPAKKDGKENPSVHHPPQFRKNIYTMEVIEFILELIDKKKKSKQQIIDEYKIPKTTLYRWITKYKPR
ncbi:helix-turn-helix domain-containing protein [Chryseobacterium sp. Alg-005]|uniref:helix-turn-helix domain-containing protein n=1 Tax=Chryseobacterium sp. Alg-005 TaxID=3159516 RepID=UPI0036F39E2C